MTGKIINVLGDATEPQRINDGALVIIPHVCNNLGGWGAGFVLALSKKWGRGNGPEGIYREYTKPFIDAGRKAPMGGTAFWVKEDQKIVVANMLSQNGYKDKATNPRPLNYPALVKCMEQVTTWALAQEAEIHCPKFGGELAGGDWKFITCLIEDIWLSEGIDVVVYEWEQDREKWGRIIDIDDPNIELVRGNTDPDSEPTVNDDIF